MEQELGNAAIDKQIFFKENNNKQEEKFQIPSVLEKIHSQTNGTPESIKKYFETLSFDNFSNLLNELNGYYRGIHSQHNMDGNGKMSDGYMPPDPKDRVPLLKEAFEKAIKEDSPEKSAMVLGMSILTIHPYLDGNGRTSRTIFALLTNGYSGSNEDKKLFAEIGEKDNEDEYHRSGSHIIDLDPSNSNVENDYSLSDLIYGDMKKTAVINRFGIDYSGNLPVRVGFTNSDWNYNSESKLNEVEQHELGNIFESNALAFVACINSFSDELYKKSLRDISFKDDEYIVISYSNIITEITDNELDNLKNTFRKVRVDYVRKIMSITERDNFETIYHQYSSRFEKWKTQNRDIEINKFTKSKSNGLEKSTD